MQTTGFLYWYIRPPGQKDGCNLEKHRIPKVLQDDHIFDLHLAQRHFGRPFMGKRGQEDETEIPAQTFLPVLLLLMSACCPVLWVDFGTYFHFWSNFFGCFFFLPFLVCCHGNQPCITASSSWLGGRCSGDRTEPSSEALGCLWGLQRSTLTCIWKDRVCLPILYVFVAR